MKDLSQQKKFSSPQANLSMLANWVWLCAISPWSWLLTIIMFMSGATIANLVGVSVPSWAYFLALSGPPLGAVIESRWMK